MVALFFILIVATTLVVGGTAVSLFLHTQSLPRVRHSSLDHAAEDSFSMRVSTADDAMSRYARNALVIVLFAIVVAAMIAVSVVNGLMH